MSRGRGGFRKGMRIVTQSQKEMIDRIESLDPDRGKKLIKRLEELQRDLSDATPTEADRINDEVNRRVQQSRQALVQKRTIKGVKSPATIFRFKYRGRKYIGIAEMGSDQFDSIEDILSVSVVMSEGEIARSKDQARNILTRRKVKDHQVTAGWGAPPRDLKERIDKLTTVVNMPAPGQKDIKLGWIQYPTSEKNVIRAYEVYDKEGRVKYRMKIWVRLVDPKKKDGPKIYTVKLYNTKGKIQRERVRGRDKLDIRALGMAVSVAQDLMKKYK